MSYHSDLDILREKAQKRRPSRLEQRVTANRARWAEANNRLDAQECPECGGEGRIPNGHGTGDQAGGWADTCDVCGGSGSHDD